METVTSRDGTPIAYWRSGSGPPLLLVHGTSADHRRWAPITPRFGEHFAVYTIDRRGRGGSGDAIEYGILREAEDVAAVVAALGAPVDVLGHSYGGLCSLEAALLTDQVRRLVLYEPPIPAGVPTSPPGMLDRFRDLVNDGEFEAALELFFREVVRMPEHEFTLYRQLPMWQERIRLVPTILREQLAEEAYRFDATRFADLHVPTLFLLGGDSPPLFRQATEIADAALPASRIVIMPGQQHIAMDTAPDVFVGEVIRFLLA